MPAYPRSAMLASMLLSAVAGQAIAAGAAGHHQHGVGKLDVAREGAEVVILLESPAADIVGFEHAPTDAAGQAALAAAGAALRDAPGLFRFPAVAGCRVVEVEVETPWPSRPMDGATQPATADGGHADIDAVYRFVCAQPQAVTGVDVQLFARFPGMQRLQVQFVSERGQGATTLTAAGHVLTF